MINKEVVVFQIEDMLSNINKENLLSFGGHIDNGAAFLELMTNVLTLLKEQEPVPVKQREAMHMLFWCCSSCGVAITDGDKFCRNCGREVKWNE